ncbi:MAG: DUF4157 domain-containing protein [Cyanobacteria bacterium J06638_20]
MTALRGDELMDVRSPTQLNSSQALNRDRSSVLQRKCACGKRTIAGGQCSACQQRPLQRRANSRRDLAEIPPIVYEVLKTCGRPLDSTTRSTMESHFDHDFSQVRVHTDAKAAASARSVNATAYTVGQAIVFGAGQYAPRAIAGKRLLAHELAHVVQQNTAHSPHHDLRLSQEGDRDEQAAEAIAQALSSPSEQTIAAESRSRHAPITQSLPVQPRVMRQVAPASSGAPSTQPTTAQTAETPCDASRRDSLDRPTPSCCTPAMLRELTELRTTARPIISNALNALSRPQSVQAQLQAHFRVNPDDSANLAIIRTQYQNMLNTMDSEEVQFWCRGIGDATCQTQGGQRRATSINCHAMSPLISMFCGNYEGSVAGGTFLSGENWVRTMIHEYAHLGCPTVGLILSSGNEFYVGRPEYPGPTAEVAVKNADSYANFAIALNSSADSGLPDWAIALLAVGGAGLAATGIGLAAHFASR